MHSIIVQKFGGTSVASRDTMCMVREKVKARLNEGYKVVVVLSARAGDTNALLELAHSWTSTPDPAALDSLVATGEQVSTSLFSMLLNASGIKSRTLLAFQVPIVTDTNFGRARILNIHAEKLQRLFNEYDVLVLAGFQGVTEDQQITTLGRGGSDTSAVAIAATLKAQLCEIYTDVEGVYTTDPRLCSSARKIDKIAYDEMLEMASMGAKVLEIRSVSFAKKYSVPLHVRSTFSDTPGTLVTKEDSSMENILVSGITYDKDQSRIRLSSIPDHPGVAATIFTKLAEAHVVVDMIVQSPGHEGVTDMNFTIPHKDQEKTLALMQDLQKELKFHDISYDSKVAKISAIGVGMRNHSGVAAKTFAALQAENINIILINTSEIKISCLVEEKYAELAVRTLHDAFTLEKNPYTESDPHA